MLINSHSNKRVQLAETSHTLVIIRHNKHVYLMKNLEGTQGCTFSAGFTAIK